MPLLPKLRGQFAEFLRESSLAPLGILYQPTCVGFRYRCFYCYGVQAFLGSLTSLTTLYKYSIGITSQLKHSFYSSYQHLNASTEIQKQFQFSLLRPLVPNKNSTGILTCFPSTT